MASISFAVLNVVARRHRQRNRARQHSRGVLPYGKVLTLCSKSELFGMPIRNSGDFRMAADLWR